MQSTIDSSKKISEMLNIAQIGVELVQAQNAAMHAKMAYYDRLRAFDSPDHVREGRIDPRYPESAEIIAFSKDAFSFYKAAKRKVYNANRRLRTACMRAGA